MHSLSAVIKGAMTSVLVGAMALAATVASAETLRIPVGHAHVVESGSKVTTVAIAAPDIADAAVGSERTVVVNGKAAGKTSLVVYNEGGKFTVYDVDVFVPNGNQQVKLHARVAEMNETAKKELGFDWFGNGKSSQRWLDGSLSGGLYTTKVATPSYPLIIPPDVGPNTDGLLDYAKGTGEWGLQTKWRALEENGDVKVLANPTLVARSGEKASFLAGGEFPVPIASGSGSNGQTTVTIEWKEFGVKVNFTPTVMDDGRIALKVETEVSQIDFNNPLVLSGFTVPTLIARKSATTVEMNSGEYLVVGGLKQSEKNKVVRRIPVLGHIPVLGFLFSNTVTDNTERELMVIVSPEMISPTAGSMPEME
jgi:pilus assembly protein CpaC